MPRERHRRKARPARVAKSPTLAPSSRGLLSKPDPHEALLHKINLYDITIEFAESGTVIDLQRSEEAIERVMHHRDWPRAYNRRRWKRTQKKPWQGSIKLHGKKWCAEQDNLTWKARTFRGLRSAMASEGFVLETRTDELQEMILVSFHWRQRDRAAPLSSASIEVEVEDGVFREATNHKGSETKALCMGT